MTRYWKEIKQILDKATPYLFGDEVDKLLDYIKDLQQKVEQLENIRKEAIKYVDKNLQSYSLPGVIKDMRYVDFNKLLNILNKGNDK